MLTVEERKGIQALFPEEGARRAGDGRESEHHPACGHLLQRRRQNGSSPLPRRGGPVGRVMGGSQSIIRPTATFFKEEGKTREALFNKEEGKTRLALFNKDGERAKPFWAKKTDASCPIPCLYPFPLFNNKKLLYYFLPRSKNQSMVL